MFELIGRNSELQDLKNKLSQASEKAGNVYFVSGEAGIGKSRLIEEFWMDSEKQNVKILAGGAASEIIDPFLIFSRAMKNEMSNPLFHDQEYTSFAEIFAINGSGLLVAQASPGGDEGLDSDIFAGMLTAVQSFVKDSFGSSKNQSAGLGRLEYGDMKILIEHGQDIFLTAVLKSQEHPDMNTLLKKGIQDIENKYGQELQNWNGNVKDVVGIKEIITKLADSKFLVRKDLEGMQLDDERIKIADTVLDLLVELSAEETLLLILEDLHWADESSLFVLNYLARNIADKKIMILGTMRPDESEILEKTIEEMAKNENYHKLNLTKLPENDVASLVETIYPNNNFPKEFIDNLSARCEGNPFFMLEYLRHMGEEQNIIQDNGGYKLQTDQYSIPNSIEDVVHQRLEGMEPDALAIAEYASCIGREFPKDAVLSMESHGNPNNALEKLQTAGVIVMSDNTGQFQHALFQELIYRDIGDRWKAVHHKCLGLHYENNYASHQENVLYELARHFSMSKEYAKTVEYCIKAGEKAEGTFAPVLAAELYEKALNASAKARTKNNELYERLGDLYILNGEFPKAIESYEKFMETGLENKTQAHLNKKIADTYEKTGEFDNGIEYSQKGLALIEGQEILETTKLLTTWGNILMRKGEYEDAISKLKESMAIAKKLDDVWEMGRINHIIGSTHLFSGDYDGSVSYLENAIKQRDEAGDLNGYSASLNNLANVYAHRGEYPQAMEVYQQSLKVAEKIGNKMGIANTLTNIASVYLGESKPDEAIELMSKSVAIEKQIGDMRGAAITLVNINVAHYKREEYDKSLAALEESREICLTYDFKYVLVYVYTGLSELFRVIERYDDSLENAYLSLKISEEIDTKDGKGMGYLNIGASLIPLDDLEKAEENLKKARQILEELSHNQLGELYQEYGRLCTKKKELDRAKEFFKLAVKEYEKMGDDLNRDKAQKELDKLN